MRHKVISAVGQCSSCSWSVVLRIGILPTSATDTMSSVTTIEKSTYTYYSTGRIGVKLYSIRVNLLVIRSNLSGVSIIPLFRCFLSCSWVFSTLPLCCVFLCLCTNSNSGRHRCLSTRRNPRGFKSLVLEGGFRRLGIRKFRESRELRSWRFHQWRCFILFQVIGGDSQRHMQLYSIRISTLQSRLQS